jgi:hypothetical protein
MPLFHVQDSDRPLWVVAKDWSDAIQQWKQQIAHENDGDISEPQGVQYVCDNDDLLIYGVLHGASA